MDNEGKSLLRIGVTGEGTSKTRTPVTSSSSYATIGREIWDSVQIGSVEIAEWTKATFVMVDFLENRHSPLPPRPTQRRDTNRGSFLPNRRRSLTSGRQGSPWASLIAIWVGRSGIPSVDIGWTGVTLTLNSGKLLISNRSSWARLANGADVAVYRSSVSVFEGVASPLLPA